MHGLIKREMNNVGEYKYEVLALSNDINEIFKKWCNIQDKIGLEIIDYD